MNCGKKRRLEENNRETHTDTYDSSVKETLLSNKVQKINLNQDVRTTCAYFGINDCLCCRKPEPIHLRFDSSGNSQQLIKKLERHVNYYNNEIANRRKKSDPEFSITIQTNSLAPRELVKNNIDINIAEDDIMLRYIKSLRENIPDVEENGRPPEYERCISTLDINHILGRNNVQTIKNGQNISTSNKQESPRKSSEGVELDDSLVFLENLSANSSHMSNHIEQNISLQEKIDLKNENQRINSRSPPFVLPQVIILDDSIEEDSQRTIQKTLQRNFRRFGDCPVCLEDMDNKELMSTNCGHIFCAKCLKHCVETMTSCPKCRKKLSLKKIHYLYC